MQRPLGGYWTHYDRHAAYLDAVFQYTWYDADRGLAALPGARRQCNGACCLPRSRKTVPLRERGAAGFSSPNSRASTSTSIAPTTGDVAGLVTFNDTDSFLGRVGLRLADRWTDVDAHGQAHRITVWGRLNLWHEFMDSPETLFATEAGAIPFTANPGKTWVETGAAATAQVSQRSTIFASLGYQWDTEGEGHAYNGKIGVRMNW